MAAGLLESLKKEILVSMGALGTNLTSKGLDLGGCIVEWLLNHPQEVEEFVKEFVDAGSDLIEIGSASANRFRLEPYGLKDKAAEFNHQVAELWREVTPQDCFLVATLGITTKFLEPFGEATFEEIYDSYYEQVINLVKGRVDAFWILTMSDTRETGAAIKAIKDCAQVPVIASMTFEPGKKGFRTMMGIDPQTAARDLQKWGADVIGTNCGGTGARLEDATEIIKEMKVASDRYLAAKPNAGTPKLVEGKLDYGVTPEEMAAESLNWISAGARIVGGCCGTTPEHIARIAEIIRQR